MGFVHGELGVVRKRECARGDGFSAFHHQRIIVCVCGVVHARVHVCEV